MAHKVAAAVQDKVGVPTGMRTGKVVSVDSATTLTANVGGSAISKIPYLGSYTPAPGDNVDILTYGATWLAIGSLGAAGAGTVLDAVLITTTGAINTPSASETDVSTLALSASVRAARQYMIWCQIRLVLTVITDRALVQARTATALTGTIVGRVSFGGIDQPTGLFGFPYQPAADGTLNVFFSTLRGSGTGTVGALGAATAGAATTWSAIVDIGTPAPWRTA